MTGSKVCDWSLSEEAYGADSIDCSVGIGYFSDDAAHKPEANTEVGVELDGCRLF